MTRYALLCKRMLDLLAKPLEWVICTMQLLGRKVFRVRMNIQRVLHVLRERRKLYRFRGLLWRLTDSNYLPDRIDVNPISLSHDEDGISLGLPFSLE
jgi:hypothetical protein